MAQDQDKKKLKIDLWDYNTFDKAFGDGQKPNHR